MMEIYFYRLISWYVSPRTSMDRRAGRVHTQRYKYISGWLHYGFSSSIFHCFIVFYDSWLHSSLYRGSIPQLSIFAPLHQGCHRSMATSATTQTISKHQKTLARRINRHREDFAPRLFNPTRTNTCTRPNIFHLRWFTWLLQPPYIAIHTTVTILRLHSIMTNRSSFPHFISWNPSWDRVFG